MKTDFLRNHINFISELTNLFYKEWSYLVPERTIDDFKRSIEKRINTDKIPVAIVGIEEEKLIGTACLKEYDMETRKDLSPWLAGVFVKSEYRKRGYGKKLIFEIQEIAKNIGVKELYLYTANAEKLYESLGWSIIEKTKYNGNEVSIMKVGL